MKRTPVHPVNPHIRNGYIADFYLNLLRNRKHPTLRRAIEHLLHSQIGGKIPEKLHLPHPFGIITGPTCTIGENVTLMHFCCLGPKDPWFQGDKSDISKPIYPTLEEGVYISMGAKVLGPVTIGAWSVIGANAVVTEDIPPFSTVFGYNRILRSTESGPPPVQKYLESLKSRGNS
jgi:serine acetyltransferase